MKKLLLVLLIFITALSLRVYHLDLNSPPLYADETGGHSWFSYNIQILNNMNLIEKIYRTFHWFGTSLTWLVGQNPLGVRLPSAIYGSVAIFTMYLFSRAVNRKTKTANTIAIFSSLLLAILPWSFMISRIGHTDVPLLVISANLISTIFLQADTVKKYIASLLLIGVTLLLYPSMVIIAPFIILLTLWYMRKIFAFPLQKIFLVSTVLSMIAVCLFIFWRFGVFNPGGRGLVLAIWRDVNTPYEIDKYRALSWNSQPDLFSFFLPPEQLANKLVYNKVIANLSIFSRNYLSFFSPDWLFLRGDAILRHSTGQVGEFYPFLLPFMVFGAFKFFQTKDKKTKLTFLVWILVSPVPAAITKDGGGYLLRAVTMLPFLTYFCALGLVESFNLIKSKWRVPYGIIIGLIGLYSAYYFFYGYFHVYPALSARAYEYGFKELSDYQVSHQSASMLVIWDGYYHNGDFRFWQNTPYDQYLAFKLKQIVIGQSTFSQTFPNLYFSAPKSVDDIKSFLKQYRPSYVVLPDRYFVKYPEEVSLLLSPQPTEEIKYPDQTTALSIYTPK